MNFRKIVAVDNTGLVDSAKQRLHLLADELEIHEDFPRDNREIIARIGNADCVLVSWNTRIDKEVIESCKGIRYIGMCCSLIDEKSANVDIKAARENGITVLGVRDYGDEGVIEFILSELIRLLKGTGKYQWQAQEQELTGQHLGLIGMGTLGTMLAERAQSFGMHVYYYNRSRKAEIEARGVKYLELDDLLQQTDIISTHLPRNTVILNGKLGILGNNKILVNTSLEPTFNVQEFKEWINHESNYAIFDRVAMGAYYEELKRLDRVIYTDKVVGWTEAAKHRLSDKVLANLEDFVLR